MKTDVSPQGMSQTGKFQGTRQELKEKLITCWTVTCKECEIDGCTCFDIRKAIDQLEAIIAREKLAAKKEQIELLFSLEQDAKELDRKWSRGDFMKYLQYELDELKSELEGDRSSNG